GVLGGYLKGVGGGRRELARNLRPECPPHGSRESRACRQVELVVMPHEHHAAAVERFSQLIQRVLDRRAVTVGRLLQLAERKRPVGAEENRFDRRGQLAQGCLGSMWIGPKRSFGRTLMMERRSSARTATNVTPASSRSSDSRISSSSSIGPSR